MVGGGLLKKLDRISGNTFRLVDHVDAEGLQDLGLSEVADPHLGEDGNRDGGHDFFDQLSEMEAVTGEPNCQVKGFGQRLSLVMLPRVVKANENKTLMLNI